MQPKSSDKFFRLNSYPISMPPDSSSPTVTPISCIGAGCVGGSTTAVIADRCPAVQLTVVDINQERIDAWNAADLSQLSVYEPGLEPTIAYFKGVV